MRDELSYNEWKTELGIWSDFTDLPAERQGGALFLTLTGKARQAVLAEVPREKIRSSNGVKAITGCLDELYEKDKSQCAFTAFEEFISYKRPRGTNIQDYLVEFNLKYSKIKTHTMELPEGVLAYYLLKCANLSDEQTNICKATCADLTYKDMRKQIEKITTSAGYSESSKLESQQISVESQFYGMELHDHDYDDYEYEYEQDEEEENVPPVYYTQQQRPYRPRASAYGSRTSGTSVPRLNVPDEFGNPTRCSFCRSVYHYVERCPDAMKRTTGSPRGGYSSRRPNRGRGFRGNRGGNQGYDRGGSSQNRYI